MKPKRVVSLLPSCTEIVYALGCGDVLVGRSHECDFPAEALSLPVCTAARLASAAGTSAEIDREVKAREAGGESLYSIDAKQLGELQPDLILTQSQCAVCAVSEEDVRKALAATPGLRARVVSLAPHRLADLWTDIHAVAGALGADEEGKALLLPLKNRVVDVISRTCVMRRRPAVACIEWLEPLMAAGNWTPDLVDFAGGANLFVEAGKHSAWLEWKALEEKNPDALVLMPCGFDRKRTRAEAVALFQKPEWRNLRAVKAERVYVADGNQYFNRPGPRLVDSLEGLAEMLHPGLFSFGHEGRVWEKW